MKKAIPFLLIGLLIVFVFPFPAYAVSVEHAPSSYEVIDVGWLQPNEVYEQDATEMGTSDFTQTVNFSGFGFNIPLTATVDAVFIHYVGYVSFASSMTPFTGYATLTFSLINGSVTARNFFSSVDGEGYFDVLVYDEVYNSFDCDVTSIFGNAEALNNLEMSVTANLDDILFYIGIDYLTVIVVYSVEAENNLAVGLVLGLIIALPIALIFALSKRH